MAYPNIDVNAAFQELLLLGETEQPAEHSDSCMPDRPNLDVARAFIQAFLGDAKAPIRLRFIHPVRRVGPPTPGFRHGKECIVRHPINPARELEGPIDTLWLMVTEYQAQGYSVYFFPAETGASVRWYAKDTDITKIRALYIDADGGLPSEYHLTPSIVIRSSQKYDEHTNRVIQKGGVFWRLDDADMPVEGFRAAQQQLIAHYPGADLAVHNLSRVMRMPGSVHRKPAVSSDELKRLLEANEDVPLTAPQLVTFEVGFKYPYRSDFLTVGFPEPPAPSHPKKTRKAKTERTDETEPDDNEPERTWAEFDRIVTFLNPCVGRDGWRKIIFAIAGLNIVDETMTTAEIEQRKRATAQAFMTGKLFHRQSTEEERKHLNGAMRDEAEVDRVFDWPTTAGWASLVFYARPEGWQERATEMFHRAPTEDGDIDAPPAQPVASASTGPQVILRRGSSYKMRAVEWLWPGWLARGKFHVLAGPKGAGKSTMLFSLLAQMTIGGKMPDGSTVAPGDVLIWSGEDGIEDTILPRIAAAGGDVARVLIPDKLQVQPGREIEFDPALHMSMLVDEVRRADNLQGIMIDSIVSMAKTDSHKNAETRRDLQPVVSLAEQTGAALIGVTHYAKNTAGKNPVERVAGTLAFGALPRVVLGAMVNAEDPNAPRRLIRLASNIGPTGGGFEYTLDQVRVPGESFVAQRTTWGTCLTGSPAKLVDELEGGRSADEKVQIEVAKDFLLLHLKDGAKTIPELQDAASANGAGSWRTIERAKRALCRDAVQFNDDSRMITAEKRLGDGRWVWRAGAAPASRVFDRVN